MSGHVDFIYLVYSNQIDNWQLYGCYFTLLEAEAAINKMESELVESGHLVVDEFEPEKFYMPAFVFGTGRRHWYYDDEEMRLILQDNL